MILDITPKLVQKNEILADKTVSFLKGRILVATPLVNDPYFEKSIIYVFEHNNKGTMGVLINNILSDITCTDLLIQLNIKDVVRNLPPIHFGGPVEPGRGFIVHTSDYITENTHQIVENVSITSTIDILQDIIAGKGPSRSIIALGYVGWEPGQLEEEILSNDWICIPATEELLFGENIQNKWLDSAKSIGVDLTRYSSIVGHA